MSTAEQIDNDINYHLAELARLYPLRIKEASKPVRKSKSKQRFENRLQTLRREKLLKSNKN
jgi:hypothetical protein